MSDRDTAIEVLFDDLREMKDLIGEVRDVLREMLALLQSTDRESDG